MWNQEPELHFKAAMRQIYSETHSAGREKLTHTHSQRSSCSFMSGRPPALYQGDSRANGHRNRRLAFSCTSHPRNLRASWTADGERAQGRKTARRNLQHARKFFRPFSKSLNNSGKLPACLLLLNASRSGRKVQLRSGGETRSLCRLIS